MNETLSLPTKGVDEKFCSDCGRIIKERAEICPNCGVRQSFPASVSQSHHSYRPAKDKGIAIILALFLGGFGGHKFYLGQSGWGILYLLFCWTFIPAIIAFIEAIVYIATSRERFEEQYR